MIRLSTQSWASRPGSLKRKERKIDQIIVKCRHGDDRDECGDACYDLCGWNIVCIQSSLRPGDADSLRDRLLESPAENCRRTVTDGRQLTMEDKKPRGCVLRPDEGQRHTSPRCVLPQIGQAGFFATGSSSDIHSHGSITRRLRRTVSDPSRIFSASVHWMDATRDGSVFRIPYGRPRLLPSSA